jgi:hypothetical protein
VRRSARTPSTEVGAVVAMTVDGAVLECRASTLDKTKARALKKGKSAFPENFLRFELAEGG